MTRLKNLALLAGGKLAFYLENRRLLVTSERLRDLLLPSNNHTLSHPKPLLQPSSLNRPESKQQLHSLTRHQVKP